MAAKNKSNEIQITRLYDAPVKLVWDAWTDPKQTAQWWGPRGFTLTTHSKDLRAGGTWKYTMHGPDGTDWPNITLYHEVEKYSRLVYDHGATEKTPPLFRVTVNFKEVGGKTKMDMTMTLPTPEAAAETKKFIKKAGGNTTWDRLAEYIVKEAKSEEVFVINHSFETSIETMFKMWTDPQHFVHWMGPTGSTMNFIRADIKTGGSTFYKMVSGDGVVMYGRAEYLEITRPTRIVYTQQFTDKDEEISRHPLAPTWPETMLTTVTLAEEGPGQTRVTVEWRVHGKATREELQTFIASRAGMSGGWDGTFDRLEAHLKTL